MRLHKYFNILQSENYSESELRRIRLVLIYNFLGVLSSLFYITVYLIIRLENIYPMIINLSSFAILCFFSIFLLSRRHYLLAKLTLMFSTASSVFIGSVFLIGKLPGLHMFFLLFSLMPILIWSSKEKFYIIFFFLLNLTGFILVEIILSPNIALLDFPVKYIAPFRITSNVITFTLIALIVFLYQRLTEKHEKELYLQSEQLKELNIQKDKFFSIIAHDMRNPFNAILNSSELLLMKFGIYTDEKKLRLIDAINKSSNALHELLENLLIWAQLQSENIQVFLEEQNISSIIDECLSLYWKSIDHKKIKVQLNLDKNININTDRQIVAIVIRNLISNAVKFTPREGEITINLYNKDDKYIEFMILDTGIGIAQEDISKLFQQNIVVSKAGTEREQGSGLGLQLCKESLDKIGGIINVKSTVNVGTSFTVNLKRA